MQLPFGKRAQCGNFYVLKHVKALGGKELKKLRRQEGIPSDIRKHLERGVLPYIRVSTITDSWSVEWAVGMTMYNAIDEIPVAMDGGGSITYYGSGYKNLGNLINGWFAYTSTVGDAEYQATVIKAMQDYLGRMSENNKAPLPESESASVMDELESAGQHKAALGKMSEEIRKGGEDGSGQ